VQIDDVINQAQTTRAVLGSQRTFFGDVQGKVKLLSDKFPIIRGLLGTLQSHLYYKRLFPDILQH
jgi:Golgi SNAP receptor complex protein 1